MGAAESWLRDRGAPKLQLMVRIEIEGALRFYEHIELARQKVIVLGRRLDGPEHLALGSVHPWARQSVAEIATQTKLF